VDTMCILGVGHWNGETRALKLLYLFTAAMYRYSTFFKSLLFLSYLDLAFRICAEMK